MATNIEQIAKLLEVSSNEAIRFCARVQQHLGARCPTYEVLAALVHLIPKLRGVNVEPKHVATFINLLKADNPVMKPPPAPQPAASVTKVKSRPKVVKAKLPASRPSTPSTTRAREKRTSPIRVPRQQTAKTRPPVVPKVELRHDWQQFAKLLEENRIEALYHVTDKSNLESIRRHGGLYSWYYCWKNGIKIPCPGGNHLSRRLDSRSGLQNYVRLSFNYRQPMMYVAQQEGRLTDPVTLRISPEVIYWQSTVFSDQNATANEAKVGGSLDVFKRIRFDLVTKSTWVDETSKKFYQAEVLVCAHIPLNLITFPRGSF
jgi:hypothetical protein